MAVAPVKQTNVTANFARNLLFFEGQELAYNYKTGQWTICAAYDGIGFYSINNKTKSIGTNRFLGNAVALQEQGTSHVVQDATITTGYPDINQGGRSLVTGVRPLVAGGDAKVSIIYRDDLNPATRTNGLLQTEDFNTTWSLNNVTISTDAIVGPDGNSTADQLQEDAAATEERNVTQSAAHSSGNVDICISVYAKEGTAVGFLGITATDTTHGAGASSGHWFDLTNGVIGSTYSTQDAVKNVGMRAVGNGWYLCWTSVSTSGATTIVTFNQSDTDDTLSYAGAGSQGIYLWGAMCEEGVNYPGGYISSGAASGTSTEHQTLKVTPNTRTDMANFRTEARFHKAEVTISGGFDTVIGADIEFTPTGKV